MIKLIAIDMDGALLNSKKELLEETETIFQELVTKHWNFISALYRTSQLEFVMLRLKLFEENHILAKMAPIFMSQTEKH